MPLPFEGAHADPVPTNQPIIIGNEVGANPQTGLLGIDTDVLNGNKPYLGLGDEIMTSFFEPYEEPHHFEGNTSDPHPISALSVGFLQDLGYSVTYSNAEAYTLAGADRFDSFTADAEGE